MEDNDSEFDSDYVTSFTHAEDDQQAADDEAMIGQTSTGGCLAVGLVILGAVAVASVIASICS